MAINVSQAFHRTSANAIDETLTLTKAQMVATNDNLMPEKYLTICQDDGKIYLYDKSNSIDVSTGRFRVFEGAGSITIDDEPTQGSTNAVQSGGTYSALDEKVDKESGKGLSTNDYTDAEKSKLAGIDLSGYVPTSQKGASNGVATLGSNGKVPMSQIPNGLDETIIGYRNETDGLFYEDSSFTEPITPQAGLFYYDELSTNFYRWNGSAFVSFTDGSTGIVIGEVTGTAYDGGKGKENRDAIGTLANLSTTSKTDLVSAVNEVNTNKVDKVAGKVLSDNNFTDAYKDAIDDLDVDISNKQNKTLSAPRTIEGASVTTVENGVDATKTHTDRSVTDTNGVHGFKVEESATKDEILFKSGNTWKTIPTSPAIQFSSLPTASGTLVGKVYQYIGATDATYTHNFYYECVSNGSGGYTWAETPVMYVDKSRVAEMPTASADELGNVYQYIGESSPTGYQKGYFYECVRNGQSYTWLGLRVQSGGGQTIQYDQMPVASVDNLNQIIQYTGETTSVAPIYTNGYFYKCVAQGTEPETYAWKAQPVQEGGSDKEDKFRYSTMPELSAENNGKIYQYIGQTNGNFTEGYSYKSDYWIKEYIGDVTDFEGTGDSRNYTISTDEIDLQTVQTGESYVKCLVPIENKGTLKITKTRISGNRLNFLYTELGTTVGSDDLYVSETWDSIAEGDTVVEEIDLSQYNASEIYLSFHIMVASGNNSYFKVSSIEQSYRQWKEEEVSRQPQQFTSAEMTEIKNAVSQETVNVNITPYHIYSPNEQVVGEWIDGKPIYEKTVIWGALVNGTNEKDVTNWNIDNLIEAVGFIKRSDGEILIIPNYYMLATQGINWLNYVNNKIQFIVQGFNNITDCYVIYKYTKTTD